jgi:hypothetical protein
MGRSLVEPSDPDPRRETDCLARKHFCPRFPGAGSRERRVARRHVVNHGSAFTTGDIAMTTATDCALRVPVQGPPPRPSASLCGAADASRPDLLAGALVLLIEGARVSRRNAIKRSLSLMFVRIAAADASGVPFNLSQRGVKRGMRPLLNAGHGFQGVALRANSKLMGGVLHDA